MKLSETPPEWTDREEVVGKTLRRNREESDLSHASDRYLRECLHNLTVVAIDPGGTTGWSVMKLDYTGLTTPTTPVEDAIHTWRHGQVHCGAESGSAADTVSAAIYTGETAGVLVLENIVAENTLLAGVTAVVFEDFILQKQNRGRDILSPVRITAALDQLLWEKQATTRFRQMPADAKVALTDDRLSNLGFYDEHGGQHARDADRHALLFLRKCRQKPSLTRSAWPAVDEARRRRLV